MNKKLLIFKVVFLVLNLVYLIVAIAAFCFIGVFNTAVVLCALYFTLILGLAVWGTLLRNTMSLAVYFYINLVAANLLLFGILLFHFFWNHVATTTILGYWRDKINGDRECMNEIEEQFNCCALNGPSDYTNIGLSVPPHCYCKQTSPDPYKRRLAFRKYHEHMKTKNFEDDSPYTTVPCAGCLGKYEEYFASYYVFDILAYCWSLFAILVLLIAMVIVLIAVRMRSREAYLRSLIEEIKKAESKSRS